MISIRAIATRAVTIEDIRVAEGEHVIGEISERPSVNHPRGVKTTYLMQFDGIRVQAGEVTGAVRTIDASNLFDDGSMIELTNLR